MDQPTLTFLFARSFLVQALPESLEDDWQPISGTNEGTLYLIYHLLLKQGYPVEIAGGERRAKVIIGTSQTLPKFKPPTGGSFIICFQMDRPRNNWAHIHIVCNHAMTYTKSLTLADRIFLPGKILHLPFPPQIGLIPRDPERKNSFRNICYIGNPKNLDQVYQQKGWEFELQKHGMTMSIISNPCLFADYSHADCILAVRGPDFPGHNKPCSKLWNAWRAGVPIILGPEPASREVRRSHLDFIEVNSAAEALAALITLRDNLNLRHRMIQNGIERSVECSQARIAQCWTNSLNYEIKGEIDCWHGSPLYRRVFYCARHLRCRLQRIRSAMVCRNM